MDSLVKFLIAIVCFLILQKKAGTQDRMELLHRAAMGKFTNKHVNWFLSVIEYGNMHQVDVLRQGVGPLLR